MERVSGNVQMEPKCDPSLSAFEFKRCTLGDFGLGPVQETEEFHLGLGLIMCLRLVTDLSGEISVLPVPSDLGGAVMQLSLPIVKMAGQL